MTGPERRQWRWWEVATGAVALVVTAGLVGPDNDESKRFYDSSPQPSFAPPAWVFAPAWFAWKTGAVQADTRLLDDDVLPPEVRRRLLALRAVDWLLFSTTQAVGTRLRSPSLGLLWTLGQLGTTTTTIATTRADRPDIAVRLAPQAAWLVFATLLGVGQLRLQRDALLERLVR